MTIWRFPHECPILTSAEPHQIGMFLSRDEQETLSLPMTPLNLLGLSGAPESEPLIERPSTPEILESKKQRKIQEMSIDPDLLSQAIPEQAKVVLEYSLTQENSQTQGSIVLVNSTPEIAPISAERIDQGGLEKQTLFKSTEQEAHSTPNSKSHANLACAIEAGSIDKDIDAFRHPSPVVNSIEGYLERRKQYGNGPLKLYKVPKDPVLSSEADLPDTQPLASINVDLPHLDDSDEDVMLFHAALTDKSEAHVDIVVDSHESLDGWNGIKENEPVLSINSESQDITTFDSISKQNGLVEISNNDMTIAVGDNDLDKETSIICINSNKISGSDNPPDGIEQQKKDARDILLQMERTDDLSDPENAVEYSSSNSNSPKGGFESDDITSKAGARQDSSVRNTKRKRNSKPIKQKRTKVNTIPESDNENEPQNQNITHAIRKDELVAVRSRRKTINMNPKYASSSSDPDHSSDDTFGGVKSMETAKAKSITKTKTDNAKSLSSSKVKFSDIASINSTPTRKGKISSSIYSFSTDFYSTKFEFDNHVWAKYDAFYLLGNVNMKIGNTSDFTIIFANGKCGKVCKDDLVPFSLAKGDKCYIFDSTGYNLGVVESVDFTNSTCCLRIGAEVVQNVDFDNIGMDLDLLKRNAERAEGVSTPANAQLSARLLKGFGILLALSNQQEDGSEYNDEWLTDKRFVSEQIKNAGGEYYSSYDEIYDGVNKKPDTPPIILLIANRPMRTKKYLTSLSLGVPRISTMWLKYCIIEQKLLNYEDYAISNGYSIELSHWINIKPSCSGVFESLKIHVYGSDEMKKQNWKEILRYGMAEIVGKTEMALGTCDVVMCEMEPSKADLAFIKKRTDAPIVTAEWVIQCLIHQRIADIHRTPYYTQWINCEL